MSVSDKPDTDPAPDRFNADSGTRRMLQLLQNGGLLAVLIIGFVIMSYASPVFLSRINIENLLFAATVVAVVAIGQAFVILIAGIDLSAGAIVALASVLSVGLLSFYGVPVGIAALVALAAGLGVGLINGLWVTILRIPPLIATLAMMSIARGIAFLFSGGRTITPVPEIYVDIQQSRIFGIPVVILGVLILALIAHLVLARTRFGREVYATGGNPVAARLAGINTRAITVAAYGISGFAAALGGLMITARLESGAATAGFGMELTVISAVVIGGVSLFGGEGRVSGVLLGVLLLAFVQNAVNLLNVPPNYDYIVSGFVIAAAAALDVSRRRLLEAGMRRQTRTGGRRGPGG